MIFRIAPLLCVCVPLIASVDGDPEAPYPGSYKNWLDTTNDSVISTRKHDDGLTAQVRTGHSTLYNSFNRGLDYSATYDVDTDLPSKTRTDELVLVAGRHILPRVRVLAGLRLVGNLGGEWTQHEVHEALHNNTPPDQYHGNMRIDPMAVIIADPIIAPDNDDDTLRGHIVASISPVTLQIDPQMILCVCDYIYASAGYVVMVNGPEAKRRLTAEVISDNQRRGMHAGLVVQYYHVGYGVEWGQHECIGRIGFLF